MSQNILNLMFQYGTTIGDLQASYSLSFSSANIILPTVQKKTLLFP